MIKIIIIITMKMKIKIKMIMTMKMINKNDDKLYSNWGYQDSFYLFIFFMKDILNVKNTNKSKSNIQLRVTFNQIFLQVKKKACK